MPWEDYQRNVEMIGKHNHNESTCWLEEEPALVVITMYFVAGGDGCEGVPGRGDIRVRELGTLMMLGVRGPLCETVRVGRGCGERIHHS